MGESVLLVNANSIAFTNGTDSPIMRLQSYLSTLAVLEMSLNETK